MSQPESQLQPEINDYGTARIEPHGAQTEPARLGPAQRLIGILLSPGETYEDINRRPTWLAPLLITIVLAVGSSLFFNYWVNPDWNRITRDMIRQRVNKTGGDMPSEESIAAQVKGFTFFGKLFPAFAALSLRVNVSDLPSRRHFEQD